MSRNSLCAVATLLAAGAFLGWLTVGSQNNSQSVAQEKTAAKTTSDKLDRTVLPIPEPKLKPITELDARNAKAPPR